jgi:hypothetical protein
MRIIILLTFYSFIILSCSTKSIDAVDNYNKNKIQLLKLKNYFSKICPKKELSVQIRIQPDNHINLFIRIYNFWDLEPTKKTIWKSKANFDEYGVIEIYEKPISNLRLKNAVNFLGWNKNEIDSLKTLLNNCNTEFISYEYMVSDNSINNSNLISIEFPTNELYSFNYYFLERCLTQSELNKCRKDCSYQAIDACVLIKYTGTSWMNECMPEKRN